MTLIFACCIFHSHYVYYTNVNKNFCSLLQPRKRHIQRRKVKEYILKSLQLQSNLSALLQVVKFNFDLPSPPIANSDLFLRLEVTLPPFTYNSINFTFTLLQQKERRGQKKNALPTPTFAIPMQISLDINMGEREYNAKPPFHVVTGRLWFVERKQPCFADLMLHLKFYLLPTVSRVCQSKSNSHNSFSRAHHTIIINLI